MPDVMAFSAEQVSRLTGLSVRRLYYWDKEPRFFSPEFAAPDRGRFGRVYSFRDLISLKTIAVLLKEHKVPLQELRRVDPWLKRHHETPWASLRLYVIGRSIFFEDPETREILLARFPAQAALPIEMNEIVREVRHDTDRLRARTSDQIGRIDRHRNIAHNAPTIAGTRIPTSAIWDFHSAGYSTEEIIREYPRITPSDVEAAIEFEKRNRQRQAS